MDVELYVYDLSRGLARQFSYSLTGLHLDAIYHTSLVFGGVEYFFGQGIHRKVPGSTHHGQPMEILRLGKTELPMDVVAEYIDSLAQIYTTASYDLFLRNCNNFTQDLSMFLLGKDIPENIRTLPQKFLETPIGQMLRSQIDQSMRSMTQAPDAGVAATDRRPPVSSNNASLSNGVGRNLSSFPTVGASTEGHVDGKVHNVTTIQEIDSLLESARKSCAVIFFTSSTCAPCKLVYPAYDELAAEAGRRAVLMKVDLNRAHGINAKYPVRATPTFMTFLKGDKENEWTGANESQLKGNVQLLVQMAWPVHPHKLLRLPSFEHRVKEPVSFKKIPPLDKLAAKVGPLSEDPTFAAIITYIKSRESSGYIQSAVPNLHGFSDLLASELKVLPPAVHFAMIDLVRIMATDPRVSGYFATERDHRTILSMMPTPSRILDSPYNLQVVTLQFACNLFTSPLFVEQLVMAESSHLLRRALENLASSCLLAQHSNTRFLASALVYNMGMFDHNERVEGLPDRLKICAVDDLEAALVQAVINETESKDTLHGLLLALGMLLYCAEVHESLWELCRTMGLKESLQEKWQTPALEGEPLLREVENLLVSGEGS